MARLFDDWLREYMRYTSSSEAPDYFHFWTGVSTIAGALRRRVWIDQKAFKWTPNFYIILVAPPGIVSKSTTVNLGMRLLRRVPGVNFGPASATWQALTKSLQDNMERVKFDGGYDIEMSCITVPASELGTFLKTGTEGFVEVLIDLWDGREHFEHSTLTNPEIKIINPWINIIGCTTPSWLRTHFPEDMIGGGLTSRVIFVYGDAKRHLVAFPGRSWQAGEYEELERDLIHDLTEISQLQGEFHITEDAYEWGEHWYRTLWTGKRPSRLASERYDSYIARKQTHMFKIAMVLSAAKGNSLVIDHKVLGAANDLLESIEPSMIRVFESIGVVDQAKRIREIAQFLHIYGILPLGDLYAHVKNIMSYEDYQKAVIAGCEAGDFVAVMAKVKEASEGIKCLRLATKEDKE